MSRVDHAIFNQQLWEHNDLECCQIILSLMFECSVIPSKEVTLTSVCLGSGISAKVYSGRYSGMDVAVEIFNEQADLDNYVDV